jgi:hypothetical protein
MGQLKLSITFRGGQADKHRISADTLSKICNGLSSDIENVFRLVSTADIDITTEDIKKESKLYLAADPQKSSLHLQFVSDENSSEWIEVAGKHWGQGLRIIGSGRVYGETLPHGINKSVLRHAKAYSFPPDNEYEEMVVEISPNGDPGVRVVFDNRFGVEIEKQLTELATPPTEIYGYEVEGILHALDDQDYENPTANIFAKVKSIEGDWYCTIRRNNLPEDINEVWKKRVIVVGRATFRPRSKKLVVDKMEILPDRPSLLDAVKRFQEVNQEAWKDVDPTEYLNDVRENN